MYKEYLDALRIVKKYKRILQEYNRNKKKAKYKLSMEEMEHRNIIYETVDEIVDTLIEIEKYLPLEKRYYYNIYKNNKLVINKNIDNTYIPINNENLSEIVSNKQYKNEFYNILEKELSPQQFKVVSLYYSNDKITQELIARKLNITQQTVRDYLKDAYKKINNSSEIKKFLKMV